jgi:hypothetical protein
MEDLHGVTNQKGAIGKLDEIDVNGRSNSN